MDFKNKIALVTGASSGIGQAIAIALADKGCKVIFTYNTNEKGAEETLSKLREKGLMFKVDLASEEDINKLFNKITRETKELDILVNNAGINSPRGLFEAKDWKEIFQIDLFSVVAIAGKAVSLMKGNGKIINITSVYADDKACYKGIAPYGAAKAALNHYTRMLSKNLAPNILVNAIAPGYVRTPLWGKKTEKEFKESGNEQLIERMIKPEEIAHMTVAVLENDAMTGEVVMVDGGISLKTI